MRYFYDTEFIEDGHTIELISIGVVAEDGREYYAVSTEFDPERAGSWVRTHVLPKLPPPASQLWRSRQQIRLDLEEFLRIDGTDSIELWAWVGAYDHVALCQLWGPMTALPPTVPRFTRELRQLWEDRGCPRMPAAATRRPRRAGRCPRSAAPVSSHHVHRRCGPRRGPLRRRTVRSRRRGPPSEPRPEQPSGNPRLPWTDELDRRHTDRPAPVASAAAD